MAADTRPARADWRDLAVRALRLLPPETAHHLALRALAAGIGLGARRPAPDSLRISLFGRDFPNPVGLAAGFDKDAEAVAGALALGFGFVEIGTVTPRPQAGNPRPRLFRLPGCEALINRMGFNGAGLDVVAARLGRRRGRGGIVGANIGKNRESEDAVADYVAGLAALHDRVDYLAINVSSPNTPGLRGLQDRDALARLIGALMEARARLTPTGARAVPLLVKVAPDLGARARADIARVALDSGLDGLIVGNTTLARDGVAGRHANEAGGLSGRPLFARSTEMLADFRRLTGGRLPLVGVGGISSAADAYAKIRAGASLVQLYTALVYRGPGLVGEIVDGLARLLAADGFSRIADAVGADVE